ncbi:hypothetical protein D1AOALGA4SA_703 [Olavius algarvensis Delta 1 endosymbiont]|nr:hypothetical protein D1AOALGA4SA_703 [Olavius algarvensis Delta 1 endosymbiont]
MIGGLIILYATRIFFNSNSIVFQQGVTMRVYRSLFYIEPAHKLKIDQNKLQNCRSNILNLVNVL